MALVFVLKELFWGCDVLCNITMLLFGGCLCFTMQYLFLWLKSYKLMGIAT